MRRTRTLTAAAALLLAAMPAAAAPSTTIAALIATPATFADTQVTIDGTVAAGPVGYGGESVYTLQKDDRRISIFSTKAPPAAGQQLEVSGRVGFRAPDEEFSFPPVVLESDRQTLP